MLKIDSLLLDAFYNENKDFFCGARIQKIQQPTRREIILQLRNQGKTEKFYININPSFYHICFMNKTNEAKRNIEIPKQPPMFCMLLRKHMEGARIINITKPNFERIFELTFENYNELGDRIEECLSIELMGKHSNVVLYNTDNNIIIGCAHNVGSEKSKERELAGGLPYIYPPKQNKKSLLTTKYENFKNVILKSDNMLKTTISENYYSLSQAVVEDVCELKNIDSNKISKQLAENEIQILFIELHEFLEKESKTYFINNDFSKFSCVKELDKKYENINSLLDDYFSFNIEKFLIKNMKTNLQNKINKDLKKQTSILENQMKQIKKKDKALLYLNYGNLLTANSYAIPFGLSNVELVDYTTGNKISIDLDSSLSVIENAKKYFDLYNKTKKAWQIAESLSEKTKSDIFYLNQILYDVEASSSLLELNEVAQEFLSDNQKAKKQKQEIVSIEKVNVDGFDVYIGKNNKQNDYLYSKISSPDDLWFHVLNTPGSHIIVKISQTKQKLSDETIFEIAKLAKKYSTAKDSTKAPVVYTLRKYVKRPNSTKSGFVVYKNETEIMVD